MLESCLDKFDAPIAAAARAAFGEVRALVPGSLQLVYDAYNALTTPFATGEKLGSAFVSVVVYPKHVNLAFFRGADLDDPHGLLRGTGSKIRHVRVEPGTFEDGRVVALVMEAAELAGWKKTRGAKDAIVIKKIYERQRSRRPDKSSRSSKSS